MPFKFDASRRTYSRSDVINLDPSLKYPKDVLRYHIATSGDSLMEFLGNTDLAGNWELRLTLSPIVQKDEDGSEAH
jgi:hypothetical protein